MRNFSIAWPVLFLTSFFGLLEISFFIQSNKIYVQDFNSLPDSFHIPFAILPGIFYFLFAQLALHLSFAFLTYSIAFLAARFLHLPETKKTNFTITIWLI